MKKIVYILILLVGLSACKKAKYIQVHSFPEVYVLAYEQDHGHCYDSVPFSVVSLDLYSEGLTLDTNRRMQGSGYNLYLSDIFVPGDTLASGEYTSLNSKHSTLNSYTFLPGRDFDGTPNGAYLLTIDQGKVLNEELKSKATDKVSESMLKRVDKMSKEQRDALRAKLKEMDQDEEADKADVDQ